MIIGVRKHYFKNGEMKLFSYYEKTYDIRKFNKVITKWYKRNPYAKRVSKHWICCDYRIDQQRPQRNVYSEAYIKIVQMTEMEEKFIDNIIKGIEKDIEYPTVWDDGKNIHYEETIYCPNCGKRRKVLTSESHCEYCGFEFDKAKVCPKCNGLNLKGSDECRICGYEFRKESYVKNNDFKVKKNEYNNVILCPKCNTRKSKYYHTCQSCGFDFDKNKQCPKCEHWIDENDKYCGYCGQKLLMFKRCSKCGRKNKENNKYCTECGNRLKE